MTDLPFAAYMFDLDGTLVDTMPLHYRAYAEVLREDGLDLTAEDYSALVGPPARVAIPKFVLAAGGAAIDDAAIGAIHARKKAAFEHLLTTTAPPRLPTAALLERVRGKRPCALVSSGNRQGVTAILACIGWSEAFGAVVTGDDVARGKPDPAPFLLAAERLGVDPAKCIAFEDTADGLESARRAVMRVVDVTDPQQLRVILAE